MAQSWRFVLVLPQMLLSSWALFAHAMSRFLVAAPLDEWVRKCIRSIVQLAGCSLRLKLERADRSILSKSPSVAVSSRMLRELLCLEWLAGEDCMDAYLDVWLRSLPGLVTIKRCAVCITQAETTQEHPDYYDCYYYYVLLLLLLLPLLLLPPAIRLLPDHAV